MSFNIQSKPTGNPNLYNAEQIKQELIRCDNEDFGLFYFIQNYVKIYDNKTRKWIDFTLWDGQIDSLDLLKNSRYAAIIKARQLGITWVVLSFLVHNALFRPAILALLFSKREEEAIELLNFRVKGIYNHLPYWMKAKELDTNTKREFALSNGSRFKASSAGGTDSYAATHVLVDEADIIYESGKRLIDLLTDIEPAIGSADGHLILISRVDKSRPNSTFKNIVRASVEGKSEYNHIFLPWNTRPDRDEEWYRAKCDTALSTTGSLDSVYEQYPATIDQALAPPSSDKRFPFEHVLACYKEQKPIVLDDIEDKELKDKLSTLYNKIPGLVLYKLPETGKKYVILADAAEGNINSDDSVAIVFDESDNEEVAYFANKFEPGIFADSIAELCHFYNRAKIFPERNNHGHAVILSLMSKDVPLVEGVDSSHTNKKYGFRTTATSKAVMWSYAADYLSAKDLVYHTNEIKFQLSDIRATGSMSAGLGNHDDYAICVGLYCYYKNTFNRATLIDFI